VGFNSGGAVGTAVWGWASTGEVGTVVGPGATMAAVGTGAVAAGGLGCWIEAWVLVGTAYGSAGWPEFAPGAVVSTVEGAGCV